MRRRSLFLMVMLLLCIVSSVLGVLFFANRKLQTFHYIQSQTGELPFLWSQVESSTKEFLITYDLHNAKKKWFQSYTIFAERFDDFLNAPFTRNLIQKDVDFQLFVFTASIHWKVINKKLEHTKAKTEEYILNDLDPVSYNKSGNVLVDFGENWSKGEYDDSLVSIISRFRRSITKSDSRLASELELIRKHVESEIKNKMRHIRVTSILLSGLILGIGGVFVLYHFIGMTRDKEASLKHSHDLMEEIQERKKTEKMLRIESRKLEVVLDAMGEGMYIVNRHLKIEFQNTYLEKEYGQSSADCCHKKYFQIDHPCQHCRIRQVIETGEIRQAEIAMDGGKNCELIFSPFTDVNGERKAIVLWFDITEKKKIEAEALHASHLASIGELAAGVAHEINNPINGIISVAELIKDTSAKADTEDALSALIIKEADRVAHIVSNLLSFSRKKIEKHSPCRVEDILSDSIGLVEHQARIDGVDIVVEMEPDLPMIEAKHQEIQQVFLNLISNSRYALNHKYSVANAEKTLRITGKLDWKDGQPIVRVCFYDKGIGIKKELLDQVCHPFFSTKQRGEGTGLGLSISHGIIKSHGGSLSIESVAGEYTRIIIDFQLASSLDDFYQEL